MDPLFVLVGPTAAGKSRASMEVARALGAEIVSLDSMLIYRGMDIGTDKPRDLSGIPHHLVDLLDPAQRFDLQRYLEQADAAIASIRERGRRALVVGGTGLYLMGLLKGVFEGAPRDELLRARLAEEDLDALHARLREVDPPTAERVHPHDKRRILRALEVHAATGRPHRYDARLAGIHLPRPELKRRIERRVNAMFQDGLVEEVRQLHLGPTASQAVGYKEVLSALRGEIDMAEARRLIVRNTLRLVRRQGTWFKRFPIHWVDGAQPDLAERLADYFLRGTITE
jgi:tRNA dimethylallyltransferase